jgi:hypothetical protein
LGIVLYNHPTIGRILVNLTTIPHTYTFVGPTAIPTISTTGSISGSIINISETGVHFCTTSDGMGPVVHLTVPSASFIISSSYLQVEYILATYDNGNPYYKIAPDLSSIDNIQTVPIATFQTITGGTISYIEWDDPGILLANKNEQRIINIYGLQRSDGLILTTSGSDILITSGSAYIGVEELTVNTASTQIPGQFVLVGHSSSIWTPYGPISGWINNLYDDGINVQSASAGAYIVNYIWRGMGYPDKAPVFLGNQYSTYAEAITSPFPETPTNYNEIAVMVGRIITQQGNTSSLFVQSAFLSSIESYPGITDHNRLDNLQGGSGSSEYYHLTAVEYGDPTAGPFVRGGSGTAPSASYLVPGATLYVVSGSDGVPPAFIDIYDTPIIPYNPPYKLGRMFFDSDYNNWVYYPDQDFKLHIGKEIIWRVANPYPYTLPQLSVVYLSGSTGDNPNAYLAIANNTNQANAVGVIRYDIPSGSTGYVLQLGAMHNVNMTGFDTGDTLWLSTSSLGRIINQEPGQPYEMVKVGYCQIGGPEGSFVCSINIISPSPNAYAGITSDVTITDNHDGTVTVSTGSVNLFSNSTGTGLVKSYQLSQTSFTLFTGSSNFVIAQQSASSDTAMYTLTTDSTYPNGINIVRVAILDINASGSVKGNWEVHDFNPGVLGLALANRTNNKDELLYGFQRQSGLTLFTTSSTISNDFGITAGNVWYGPNSHILSDISSSNITDTDTYHWVLSGSGTNSAWYNSNKPGYDNGNYNDPVMGLVPLTPLSWSVNFIYRIVSDPDSYDCAIILGSQQFDNELDAANNSQEPSSNLPSMIANLGLLVGSLIVQSGSTSPTVKMAYGFNFVPSVVTQHNSLLGLQGGTGGQYYHLTDAEYVGTGTGVFVKINTPTLFNATISGSLFGTITTVSTASYIILSQTASFVSLAQSASYVATASYVGQATFITTAQTASYVAANNVVGVLSSTQAPIAISASWVSSSTHIVNADTASFVQNAISASYLLNYAPTISASWASSSLSSSLAITASYAMGIPTIKSGIVAGNEFTGSPRTASIVFTKPFPDNNYTITVNGESSRTWTIQNKVSGSFQINANNNTAIANNTFWQAISTGEFYS